jgi:hypothetical protein
MLKSGYVFGGINTSLVFKKYVPPEDRQEEWANLVTDIIQFNWYFEVYLNLIKSFELFSVWVNSRFNNFTYY